MHLIDTLDLGGAERVAVNLANGLPRDRYQTYLCTTRREGALEGLLKSEVGRLRLKRRRRLEAKALTRLVGFVRTEGVQILHAHETSVFLAALASLFPPYPALVWHDHFGRHEEIERPVWLYRLLARRLSAVIAVNESLAEWSRARLRVPPGRVWYVPNFVSDTEVEGGAASLPGLRGSRIVCVANLRTQKDHLTLLDAMTLVVRRAPAAHLLLVGATVEAECREQVTRRCAQLGLEQHVSFLGSRPDVPSVLQACDIGVLSSVSEGLPLALLEYGMARLPAVATRVGQCTEVLAEGQAGMLVPPRTPGALAAALLELLGSPAQRVTYGNALHHRVKQFYSEGSVIQQICQVYDSVLRPNTLPRPERHR
jgi:glycosyltransferase involved in cell wall biosynthesis